MVSWVCPTNPREEAPESSGIEDFRDDERRSLSNHLTPEQFTRIGHTPPAADSACRQHEVVGKLACSVLICRWQLDHEHASLGVVILNPDITGIVSDKGLDEVQTETGTSAFQTFLAFPEDALFLVVWNTRPVVGDPDPCDFDGRRR